MIKLLDTFAWVGGFHLALEQSLGKENVECIGYSEIDKYAKQVYNERFPNSKDLWSITELDIDALPTFDLEWLFIHLRARSVEEVVHLNYKCNNTVKNEEGEDKKCMGIVEIDVNLLEIEPFKNPDHTNKVQINENLGIVLKYPTFEMVEKYENLGEAEVMSNVLVDCIDYIYDKDQMYHGKDTSREELTEFIDSLQQKDLAKFKVFFDTVPEVKKDVSFECPKCKYKEDIAIKGIQSFFV